MSYFDEIIDDIEQFRKQGIKLSLFEKSLLATIKKLCETGELLEAENERLSTEIAALKREMLGEMEQY